MSQKSSLKVMTIVGTRPEIIRLASVMKKLDTYCNHILVHTGQNYDYELNKVFFEDLDLRAPDYMLDVKADTLHEQLGNIISKTGVVIQKERPDAVLILGDTNSALSVINAKRLKIPIFHMEAGDRSFDENVPEELNRRIVDHIADVDLPYTEYSRRNLLREGIHPGKIFVTGSPIREVYDSMKEKFKTSKILEELKLKKGDFITASIHREENVDRKGGLDLMVKSYNALAQKYAMPIIVSTHPRTKRRLESLGLDKLSDPRIVWHKPFGLIDYIALQVNSFCVVSDSGTIHEDSSILNFPAIAIRKSTEKAESIDAGHCVVTGLDPDSVLRTVELVTTDRVDPDMSPMPAEYLPRNVSSKVVRILLGMTKIVDEKVWGIRRKNMSKAEWAEPFDVRELVYHEDKRGFLFEILRYKDYAIPGQGQLYTFSVEPGQRRGDHYHLKKREWFTCVYGEVLVLLSHKDGQTKTVTLSCKHPQIIYAGSGAAHALLNKTAQTAVIVSYGSEQHEPHEEDTFVQKADEAYPHS